MSENIWISKWSKLCLFFMAFYPLLILLTVELATFKLNTTYDLPPKLHIWLYSQQAIALQSFCLILSSNHTPSQRRFTRLM